LTPSRDGYKIIIRGKCMKTSFTVVLLAAALLSAAPLFGQSPRYALVIGNGNYTELGKLKNPANDAHDIGEALKNLGFQVDSMTDADLPAMEDAVLRLGSRLSTAKDCIGFFYYAGHGVQSNGINYLIPADAHIPAEAFLKTRALAAQEVLDVLKEAKNQLNIVVLDACRDNPFSWARSGTRGLSVVSAQPPGSILVYATSSGSVAQDGTGRNGIFTEQLLKNIQVPDIDVMEVFKRTGAGVQSASSGSQVPAVYNQYFGTSYLASSAKPAGTPTTVATPATPAESAAKAVTAPALVAKVPKFLLLPAAGAGYSYGAVSGVGITTSLQCYWYPFPFLGFGVGSLFSYCLPSGAWVVAGVFNLIGAPAQSSILYSVGFGGGISNTGQSPGPLSLAARVGVVFLNARRNGGLSVEADYTRSGDSASVVSLSVGYMFGF
jgi:hypothetical protein